MLERLDNVVFSNNDIDFDDTEFDAINIHFFNNKKITKSNKNV